MFLTLALLSISLVIVDGDTFRQGGETIRIANIDTPEIRGAKCDAEKRLGELAKRRLTQLLQAGPITVSRGDPLDGRKRDRNGRTLATIVVNGEDVGELLIAEGMARRWKKGGHREPWCSR